MRISNKQELINFLIKIGINPIEKGNDLWAVCPYHQEEKPSFSISIKKDNFGTFFCFGCHAAGNIQTLINDFCDSDETIVTLPYYLPTKKEQLEKIKIFNINDLPVSFRSLNQTSPNVFLDYLVKERKLTYEQILKYKIGYCRTGFYRGRIIIPIEIRQKVVSFAARSIYKGKKRYLYPKDSNIKDIVFPFDSIDFNVNYLFLVEGLFDMLALERIGLKNVLCLFNNYVSKKQARILRQFKKIFYCPDPDEGGLLFLKQAKKYALFSDIYFLRLKQDPGSLNQDELRKQIVKRNLHNIFNLREQKIRVNYKVKQL